MRLQKDKITGVTVHHPPLFECRLETRECFLHPSGEGLEICPFWRNSQKKKNKKKMRRLLSPLQLPRKKDHRSTTSCVAAELKTFWDSSLLHSYICFHFMSFCDCSPSIFAISSTLVIHCKVVCTPLLCDKKRWSMRKTKHVQAYRPTGDSALLTGTEGFSCRGWSTRSCRGIPRSSNLSVSRV